MGFMRKTRFAGRLCLFAVVMVIVIGGSLPAVHAISQDRALQSEPVNNTVDRSKKGDRLRKAQPEDAAQKPGGKQIDVRPQETKLAAIEGILRQPSV
jgi:hypothetical protein